MGKPVEAAPDLGELLTLDPPPPAPDRGAPVDWYTSAHATRARWLLGDPTGTLRPADAHYVTDLQAGLLNIMQGLYDKGRRVGHP
jgi:hypothetical protein